MTDYIYNIDGDEVARINKAFVDRMTSIKNKKEDHVIYHKFDDSLCKSDFELLQTNGFNYCKDEVYNIEYVYFTPRTSYYSTIIVNKDSINDIITALKNGCQADSEEIKNIINRKFTEDDLYEFDRYSITRPPKRNKNNNCSYAKRSFSVYKRQISLLETHDGYYIVANIPNGDFADGRPRTYKVFSSLESLRQMAIKYVDSEIEKLKEVRNNL